MMVQLMYGYRIKNGGFAIGPEEAEVVKQIFEGFLNSKSRKQLSFEIRMTSAKLKQILNFTGYARGDVYPHIIKPEDSTTARAKLKYTSNPVNRKKKSITPPQNFYHGILKTQFKDPYEQAEYLYSLIQTEEEIYGQS